MSKVQKLRSSLKQRLPADEEEIFELFERTTAEYEEELCGLKEENERQRELLDAVFLSDDKTDTGIQQLLVKEEVFPKQQEWTCSLGQSDHKLHYMKNEEEEQWTSEKRAYLQVLEVDSMKCAYDLKPQLSYSHQPQTEEKRGVETPASSSTEQMKTESNGEEWGGSELAVKLEEDTFSYTHINNRILHSSEPENEAREPEPCLYSPKNKTIPICDGRGKGGLKILSHKYGQRIGHKGILKTKKRIHTREKSYSCTHCGKHFNQNGNLKKHMAIHTGGKPFRCSQCGKTFNQNGNLKKHMMIHTGEKPFSCAECGKSFNQNGNLKKHVTIHTGGKRFSCYHCGKTFDQSGNLKKHMAIHAGGKPFSCSECAKTFHRNCELVIHMRSHTGEKPFTCSECDKTFSRKWDLKTHKIIHTGQKPFCCSQCGKTFNLKGNLRRHMSNHTGK